MKWIPKQYDHNGYLVKYDENNNPVKYDENGYRVEKMKMVIIINMTKMGIKLLQIKKEII